MITEEDLARLPRWKIQEPNHKEFERFKRQFLLGQAQTSKQKELLRHIGELQSEIDTLKHALATCQSMTKEEYKSFMIEMLQGELKYYSGRNKKNKKYLELMERMKKVLIENNLTW